MYKHIVVALDGSAPSQFAGQAAIAFAAATGARVTACHIYGAEMHRQRFTDMEPGLPMQYQEQERLSDLRTSHDRLMDEGFRALSTGYVEDFVASARDAGIAIESVAAEGRSYVGILRLAQTCRADLIALGAEGLGAVGDGMLGGTTSRVLTKAPCDMLVARCRLGDGPILAGVDGSEEALEATGKAVSLARAMNKPVHIVSAYDPDFHTRVFNTMAHSLSAERQEEVGLANQEKLHDDIINDGLGKLYSEFLYEAQHRFDDDGVLVRTLLVTGKAYRTLDVQARQSHADLIVVGRYGHHRESCSRLGSNAEGLIRSTASNVLLVGGCTTGEDRLKVGDATQVTSHQSSTINNPLTWDGEAQTRLRRVPFFVRGMARRTVENAVRESGGTRVSLGDFDAVAAKFGMGKRGENS